MPPTKKEGRTVDTLAEKPLKLRTRRSRQLWWVPFLVGVLCAMGYGYLKEDQEPRSIEQPPQLIPVPKTQRVTTRPVELERRATDRFDMVYGRTYVIVGTFEYEANAQFVVEQHPGTRLYRFDEKWVVTAFETDSRTEAERFIAADTRYKEDFSPWAYTKK